MAQAQDSGRPGSVQVRSTATVGQGDGQGPAVAGFEPVDESDNGNGDQLAGHRALSLRRRRSGSR